MWGTVITRSEWYTYGKAMWFIVRIISVNHSGKWKYVVQVFADRFPNRGLFSGSNFLIKFKINLCLNWILFLISNLKYLGENLCLLCQFVNLTFSPDDGVTVCTLHRNVCPQKKYNLLVCKFSTIKHQRNKRRTFFLTNAYWTP